jgi:hypothetical protein
MVDGGMKSYGEKHDAIDWDAPPEERPATKVICDNCGAEPFARGSSGRCSECGAGVAVRVPA